MATLDCFDDWKLDFDFETEEPVEQEQTEMFKISFDEYLDAFGRIDTKDMTMQ